MPSDTSTPSTVHSPNANPRTPQSQILPLLEQADQLMDAKSLSVHRSQEHDREDEMMQISREATPSSPSIIGAISPTASGSASSPRSCLESTSTIGSAMGAADEEGDVERFLKKLDMEKKMQALQQRLELASVKATNGWKDMSINEIENKLPPTPLRKRTSQMSLLPSSPIVSSPVRSPAIPYEPPSPSRPWQLIDVLWQPLPPPSHGRYPASPISPRKRGREDLETIREHLNGLGFPLSPSKMPRNISGGHRRASSSISAQIHERERLRNAHNAGPSSPLRFGFEERGKKKRSTSHSTPRSAKQTTTSQDVDAAKALTTMLGSGSGGLSDDDTTRRRDSHSGSALSAPLLGSFGSLSLPIPEAFARSSGSISPTLQPRKLGRTGSMSTPRAADLRTPNSHTRSHIPPDSGSTSTSTEVEQEDKTAAELMMFLAHSPSPMRKYDGPGPGQDPTSPSSSTSYRPSLGSAARVLFADSEEEAVHPPLKLNSKTKPKPNLPPIFTSPNSSPNSSSRTVTGPIKGVNGDIESGIPSGMSSGGGGGQVFAPSNLALAPPITPDSNGGPGYSPRKEERTGGEIVTGGA